MTNAQGGSKGHPGPVEAVRVAGATALAVMARYPVAGEVKTRLARTIGAAAACDLYRAFLQDIQQRFSGGGRTLVWAYHPPERDFASLFPAGTRCIPQLGSDLSARMHHCFCTLAAEGFSHVIMIGADVPHVRDEWLDAAEAALAHADIALGPSDDGGYYLIAMAAPHDVFTGIQMSTDRVLKDTLGRAAALGLRVELLPPTFDVDEPQDLERLRGVLAEQEAEPLPHTQAVLERLGQT